MTYVITRIDYKKIADAETYYIQAGFAPLNVPWIVSHDSYYATKPAQIQSREFYTLDGYLNASAEQSFIELLADGATLSRNLAITPCFRDEPILDALHHAYFVKLELIDMAVAWNNLKAMIETAASFFEQYLPTIVEKTGH